MGLDGETLTLTFSLTVTDDEGQSSTDTVTVNVLKSSSTDVDGDNVPDVLDLFPDDASEAKRSWAIENSLLKRIGSPEDVARTVIFLSESDFATGAVYFMDGGRALV